MPNRCWSNWTGSCHELEKRIDKRRRIGLLQASRMRLLLGFGSGGLKRGLAAEDRGVGAVAKGLEMLIGQFPLPAFGGPIGVHRFVAGDIRVGAHERLDHEIQLLPHARQPPIAVWVRAFVGKILMDLHEYPTDLVAPVSGSR